MQETSEKYKRIFADPAHKARIRISFTPNQINTEDFISLKTSHKLFDGSNLKVGTCVAGQIDAVFYKPDFEIKPGARLQLWIQLYNDTESAEWLRKGIYFIDTIEEEDNEAYTLMHITGYDAMIKTEQPYSASNNTIDWPAKDIDVLPKIRYITGLAFDNQSLALINKGYMIDYPGEYSVREILSYIAAMYGGWWVANEFGQIELVQLAGIPKETRLLTDETGNRLIIGGDRISV